ncbi:MAG TPA: hypothetical protein VGK74_02815 [Symbiobacteriaceae bacterium]|jgi:hypothetical protein
MSARIEHPMGLAAPAEWAHTGHTSAAEFRKWLESKAPAKGGKFHAKAGKRAGLGHYLRSALEADAERLLRFLGYQSWIQSDAPPAEGRWYRYEGAEFKLTAKKGATVFYKPDFHLWDEGRYSLWETKGCMDARSKRALTLMKNRHPELPLAVISREELQERKTTALWEARRRGERVLDIPNWEGHA